MKVRDVIKQIQAAGWQLRVTEGSHRQFKHPTKPGRVTIAGKPSHDLAPGTLKSILRQAGLEEWSMRYLVVVERAGKNYSVYVPDLPGCVATAESREKAQAAIRRAIEMHLRGLREDNLPIPEPSTAADFVTIA